MFKVATLLCARCHLGGRTLGLRIPPAEEHILLLQLALRVRCFKCRCAVRPLKIGCRLGRFHVDPAALQGLRLGSVALPGWRQVVADNRLLRRPMGPGIRLGICTSASGAGCCMSLLAIFNTRSLRFLWHFLRFCSTSFWRHHRRLLIGIFSLEPAIPSSLLLDLHPIHPAQPTNPRHEARICR